MVKNSTTYTLISATKITYVAIKISLMYYHLSYYMKFSQLSRVELIVLHVTIFAKNCKNTFDELMIIIMSRTAGFTV